MYLKYPLSYISIVDYFNKGVHNGLDLITNKTEEIPVYAPYDGTVVSLVSNYNTTDTSGRSYGNYVKIKHSDEISTLCAHLKYKSVTLKVGDKVKQGDLIGIMGNTGYSFGRHVHYEVFLNNVKVDPLLYTYVYEDQSVSTNSKNTKGLLYYKQPDITDPKKIIQELEDKNKLLNEEIKILKEDLNYIFKYTPTKSANYKIKLNEGETLYIKKD